MILERLRSKRGSILIWAAGILLAISIIGSAALEYRQGLIIARGVNEMMEKATVTMATSNSYNSFAGVRETKSNAYGTSGNGSWYYQVDTSDLEVQLRKLFNFERSGSSLINTSSNGVEYELTILTLECRNDLNSENALRFDTKYKLRFPFRFMGTELLMVEIDRQTSSSLTPKF